jgi:hypothetical protein
MNSVVLERIGNLAHHRSMQPAEKDSLELTFAAMNSNDQVTARQDVQARWLVEARARDMQGSIARRFDALEEVQVEVLSSDGASDI